MGIFGELAGEGLGKLAGQYLGGDSGRDIGGQVGKFAGSFLPFKKGGKVRKPRKMRKGGIADEGEAMKRGGRVRHTRMADGGIVAGQFVPAIHIVAGNKPGMGIQVPPPEVLGYKPLFLMQ